ncbi:MAG: PQQ-like beta-propeller repeat protein [Planctomycetes bacterium]|nr:PQQ-like beta-propeller repeat protein [Planctomycetota bacterium]
MNPLVRIVPLLAVWSALVAEEPLAQPAAEDVKITVRLVTDRASRALVSEREDIQPVVETQFDASGTKTVTVGERATLWVRGASVDGKFTFERYYQGKYINRSAELEIAAKDLGVGEHAIEPGHHRFTLAADGKLSSADPEIQMDHRTVSLRLHRVQVMAVDGEKSGPLEQRLLGAQLGLYALPPKLMVDAQRLPSLSEETPSAEPPPANVLSHARVFYPLNVYLPSNEVGQGYLLYPCWQAFHVTADGKVSFQGPRVPGLEADGLKLVIPHRSFAGRLNTRQVLSGAIGSVPLQAWTRRLPFAPSLEPLRFGAGMPGFHLVIDPDFSKNPNKFFMADNTGPDPFTVRLLALEWEHSVLARGEEAALTLRLLESHALFRAEDVSDWKGLAARLKEQAAAEPPSPGKQVLNGKALNPKDRESLLAVKADGEPDARTQGLFLSALNAALYDPLFYQKEAFEKVTLPEALQALAAKGPGPRSLGDQIPFHRKLIEEAYPAEIRKLDRTPSLPTPVARLAWSPYRPADPAGRTWTFFEPSGWKGEHLTFRVPELDYGFYVFRVMVGDASDASSVLPLEGEFLACVLAAGQTGTASFSSNKGRDAFVAGEDVRLHLALRSQSPRQPGKATIVLRHPGGRSERVPFDDPGGTWYSRPLVLPAAKTRQLRPGAYELAVENLPAGMACLPFRFDLVGRVRKSLFSVIQPSKYTQPMNELVAGHLNAGSSAKPPYDLDRAVASLAELGYNRLDLMTYTTHHHVRPQVFRENLASGDDRLMAPDSVYTPSPRDQILNACVRHQVEFSDVLLSYNDFHLPRYIDGYVDAARRWARREAASMRHSPAFSGLMLYDEMYQVAVVGVPEIHATLFPKIRRALAEQNFGVSPEKIHSALSRYLSRPPAQREAETLDLFLRFRQWELHGWGDFNGRVADGVREICPEARIGTYHQSFTYVSTGLGAVCSATDLDNGYHPDVFEKLDIRASVHYTDNGGGWVHSPIMAAALSFAPRRPVFVNIPVMHEALKREDGQYQRQMALAMLSQGVDGVSMFGLNHDFRDGPNPEMMSGKETTGHLNREILAPFGEIAMRTEPGYRRVGIVNLANQHILSEFKPIRTSNQIEELWVACWRLGYPATFLREDAFETGLEGFQVIFVPGVRFEGELPPKVLKRLEEAVRAGCKVVVERDNVLSLPGVVRLDDLTLQNFYFGASYAPSFYDDELNKVYEKSQVTTDALAKKLPQWTEAAASGPFQVGPNWRSSGSFHYLIMANFDDPDTGYAVKQVMAKPGRVPLRVPAHRGSAAYDLLAGKPISLARQGDEMGLEVDMTRVQGAMIAFLPEPVGKLRILPELSGKQESLRLAAELVGQSGKLIPGVFPTRIRLLDGQDQVLQEFYRVLGQGLRFELDLPADTDAPAYIVEVREAISGQTCRWSLRGPVASGVTLELLEGQSPHVPYPREVRRFLEACKKAVVVAGKNAPGAASAASDLAAGLAKKGVACTVLEEDQAFRFPSGDPSLPDPMSDGFHSWRQGFEIIQPAAQSDAPVILLGGRQGSYLLEALASNGYLTDLPRGAPGQPAQPSLQVAPSGLHAKHDTLCLIAQDSAGLVQLVQSTLGDVPEPRPEDALSYAPASEPIESKDSPSSTPALEFMGNNEMVTDIQMDRAGNLYATTWGHGKNLYSLDAGGKLRFARALPEMAPTRLEVLGDRLLAYTAAGARWYQLTLDGQPVSQARLNLDPGPTHGEDGYHLSWATYSFLPDTRQLAYLSDATPEGALRIVDEQGKIVAEWMGEEYRDKDYTDRVMRRGVHGFAFSPDRSKIAQIETTRYLAPETAQSDRWVHDTHLVMRDPTGKLLHEVKDIANDTIGAVEWAAGAPGPTATAQGTAWQFDGDLKLLGTRPVASGLYGLSSGRYLTPDGHALRYLVDGREAARIGPMRILPTVACISPDQQFIFLLDEYGVCTFVEAATGKIRRQFTVTELGHVVRFSADSSRFFLGGLRGGIAAYDLEGRTLWRAKLADFNDALGKPAPLYDASFRDLTPLLWRERVDEPGEIDALVPLDASRLVNGDAEAQEGWQGEAVSYHPLGCNSSHSLKVGPQTVYQEVSRYLGSHVTWVLEFFYRACPGHSRPRLLAGLQVQSRYPDSVAREFDAGEDWRFARIVLKSGLEPKLLRAGFSAAEGEVLVDTVRLRQVRFPSVNHLLHPPLHGVEPVVLTNPLFSEKYDPAGRLRDEAPNRVIVANLPAGALNLVESAFLQNGRINEMSSTWYIHPYPGDTKIGIGMKEPRWVSMVALYFNAYDEANVTPHFDILALDVDTKEERLVASVRHNRQLFRLLKFPPVHATQVTLRLVNAIQRLRTLTEIELYGPLSGREDALGFADPEGENTYMGSFSRVDKRAKSLAAAYQPLFTRSPWGNDDLFWSFPVSQILVSEDRFYLSRALGHNEAYAIQDANKPLSQGRSGGLGFSPFITLYGGVLLKPGNDGRLYAIDPQSSRELWSVSLGERLACCPIAIGQDVFIASDTGRLYKIDLASGSVLMEVALSGGVWGSLATDGGRLYLITEDGQLQAFEAASGGRAWAVPVAPYTESTPAVDSGMVYLADQKGDARAVEAASGRVAWTVPLGQEFTRCPVVTSGRVLFGCRGGKLAALDRASGNVAWSLQVNSRFSYEPLVLGDQVLYFDDTKGMLAGLENGSAKEFPNLNLSDDPFVPISYYRGHLFFVPRHMEKWHQGLRINDIWVGVAAGTFSHLPAQPAAKP